MKTPNLVIGAGAAGLVVAIGLAKAGKKVLLIDKGTWGGDCTNFGCIPSKTLIAASHQGESFESAMQKARALVKKIRSHEDPLALKKIGVETLEGKARFLDAHTLDVNGQKIKADKIIIATGSRPKVPSFSGIDYHTNETIFELETPPKHLAILGGGPIGCELAQAFANLKVPVTLIHHGDQLLEREEKAASDVILKSLEQAGVTVHLRAETTNISKSAQGIELQFKSLPPLQASHLLVAIGRTPNCDTLDLEKAGVDYITSGISIDAYGRTNQKHIFAVGDVSGEPAFTHIAENRARTLLWNLLLPWPFRFKIDRSQAIPRVTYTDPEVASAGLLEKQALERYGKNVAVYDIPFSQVDRAMTEGREEGFVKIVTKKWSSQILGVTIVAPRAGEMLQEVTLAMREKIPLRRLASLIHPYPTFSLAIRKAADQWLTKTLLGKK